VLKNSAVLLAALAILVLGTYATAALGGDDSPSPTPEPSATPTTPTVEPSPSEPPPTSGPSSTPVPSETAEAEDADDVEETDDEKAETEDGAGRGGARKAALIADAFGVPEQTVLDLRSQGNGWGTIVKLLQLSAVTGQRATDIAAQSAQSGGPGFGQRFSELTEEQRAGLDALPRNLGEIMSGKNKSHGPKNR
jgi:hypothetical protein